jgi:hypothetical protein
VAKIKNMFLRNYIIGFLICLPGLKSFAGEQAKQNINDPSIKMLKEFYTAYNTAWSTADGNVLIKKLESLRSQYCTVAYQKKFKEEFKEVGLDHDELVNDAATDVAHLNTLKVVKDLKKANEYIVSYMVFGKDVSKNPLREEIVIHVFVMKENGTYKIAAIKNGNYTVIPNN